MLELNNYYIQKVENLTDLFTIIFTIVDDIYNDIIPISIRNRAISKIVNFAIAK